MQNVEYYTFGGPAYFFGRPLASFKTLEKIKSFSSLPTGWNYGEGGPIQISVIQRAIDLYWTIVLNGVVRTDAFAGADGEILLTAYNGEHYLGIVIEQDGEMTFRHEFKDDDLKYIEADSISEIKIAIGEAVLWWNTYDFFIQRTSSVNAIDLMNYPLDVRSLEGYPSFIVNVWNAPGQLVIMRGNFTST
jgi:hypothetical protein